MKLTLEFNMDNAAFGDGHEYEAARILRKYADNIEAGADYVALMDINGNRVGTMSIEE